MNNISLKKQALLICDWFCENYPSLLKNDSKAYRGWTKDILDLRKEEDIFKLFILAINWNTNICWEIGLAAFELLDEKGLLTIDKLQSVRTLELIEKSFKDFRFKMLLRERIKQIQKRPYGTKRKIRSGPRGSWVRGYYAAASNWDFIRELLHVDEIVKGNCPRLDGREIIDELTSLFQIKVNSKSRKMLVVKTFLICRELNCQNVAKIDLEYCCIPDSRVKEQMQICGFPVSNYFATSRMISNYFFELYDLPLFYFFDYCKQNREKSCSNCMITNYCGQKYKKVQKKREMAVGQKEMNVTNLIHFSEITKDRKPLRDFLEEIIVKINKLGFGQFELNNTTGYYSIQVSGRMRNKNVVCFVKDEPILSINYKCNISKSMFKEPLYDGLKERPIPPKGLQLREADWSRYSNHIEYDIETDKELILQICQKCCKNFLQTI